MAEWKLLREVPEDAVLFVNVDTIAYMTSDGDGGAYVYFSAVGAHPDEDSVHVRESPEQIMTDPGAGR